MENLFDKVMNQNFVPVVDDKKVFIGIRDQKRCAGISWEESGCSGVMINRPFAALIKIDKNSVTNSATGIASHTPVTPKMAGSVRSDSRIKQRFL